MGFIDESQAADINTVQSGLRTRDLVVQRTPIAEAVAPENDSSLMGAAFRQQNLLTNAVMGLQTIGLDNKVDPTFSARRQARADGLTEYIDRFNTVQNRDQYEYMKSKVAREVKDRDRLNEANGVVSFAAQGFAAVVDPVNIALAFVPGGAVVRGAGFAKNAARLTAIGALESAATELPLYSLQETRTGVESAFNISAGAVGHAVLGGVLGRFGDKVSKETKDKLAADIGETVTNPEHPMVDLSSAVVKGTSVPEVDGTLLKGNAGTRVLDRLMPRLFEGEGQKAATSEFKVVREYGQKLGIDNLRREGVAEQSAELLKKYEEKDVIEFAKATKLMSEKLDSLGELGPSERIEVARQLREMGLHIEELDHVTPDVVRTHALELVGYAARNGYEHVIPQVAGAAKVLGRIYENDLERSISLGLVKEEDAEVLGATSYFTRVFNKQKIDQNQKAFIDTLTQPIAEKLIQQGEEYHMAMDLAEGVARSIKDKLIGTEGHPVYSDAVRDVLEQKGHGKLTARTLDIPDSILAPFLENNAAKVLAVYKRSTAPQRALKEATGYVRWQDFKAGVLDPEWRVLESNDKAVSDRWKRDVETLQVLFERVSGHRTKANLFPGSTGEQVATVGRIARGLARPVYLGGAAISSLVDAASMVLHQGFTPVMKAWAKTLSSSEFRNMTAEQAHRLGAAAELVMRRQHRAMREGIAENVEMQFAYQEPGRFERGLGDFNESFSYWTGQTGWNDVTRRLATTLSEDRILRNAEDGWDKLPAKEHEFLKVMGIDADMLSRIREASTGATENINGVRATDVTLWRDAEAAKYFDLAALKSATTELASPTASTLPSWADGEAGKWLMQFKSFIWAHYQQTLYVGVQRADTDTFMAMVTALGLGMAVAEFQAIASGRNEKKSLDERMWAGLDKSGIGSLPFEVWSQADLATRLATGGRAYLRPYLNQKYRDATFTNIATGPAGALIAKAADTATDAIGEAVSTGAVSDKTQNRFTSMLPGQNAFYLRPWLATLEFVKGQTEYLDRIHEAYGNAMPGFLGGDEAE